MSKIHSCLENGAAGSRPPKIYACRVIIPWRRGGCSFLLSELHGCLCVVMSIVSNDTSMSFIARVPPKKKKSPDALLSGYEYCAWTVSRDIPKNVLLKAQNMACIWFKNQPKFLEPCLNILSKRFHSISKSLTVSFPNPSLHLL